MRPFAFVLLMIPGITKSGILDVPRASSCEKRSPNSERTNAELSLPTVLHAGSCSTQGWKITQTSDDVQDSYRNGGKT